MSATHLNLYYHIIFSTKERRTCIHESWVDRLHEYLGGIIRGQGGVAEEVGGVSDHVHILVGLKATHCLSEIMRQLKSNSSGWIRNNIERRFWGWQDGYGAFTVSNWDIKKIRRYIREQKIHHRKNSFKSEYLNLLRECGIKFDEKYLW